MNETPFWLIASADTVLRWGVALDRDRLPYHLLAWSQIEAIGDPARWRARFDEVRPDLVLLTSANAARVLPDAFGAGRPAACVGALTAEEASRKGFDVRHVGRSTGETLARSLGMPPEGRGTLLFLRGREVRPETTDRLRAQGWRLEEETVYEARPRPSFVAEIRAAPKPLGFGVGSPVAAAGLREALTGAGREALVDRPAVGIGPTTADRLLELGFSTVTAPEVPGVEGLVTCLRQLLPGIDPSR